MSAIRFALSAGLILCSFCMAFTASASDIKTQLNEAIQDYQFQDFDDAETKFRLIIDQAPGNVTAHYYLGVILLQKKKPEEAIPHLELVHASPAEYSTIDGVLTRAYLQAGENKKALALLEKLHQSQPDDEGHSFNFAKALQADGQNHRARPLYEALIASNGKYADPSRYQLGQMLSGMGAYTSAAEQLRAIDPNSPYNGVASKYLDALAPVTKPLSVYVSGTLFYSDNATSGSSTIIPGSTSTAQGSQGSTWIGMVSTRNFEISPLLRTKISYLFYGKFHQHIDARGNDFYGHFLNPSLSYHPTQEFDLVLKGELQRFHYNQQWLSNNYGGTLTATWHPDKQASASIHGGYLAKRYTDNYLSSGVTTSLKYLDTNTWSIGAGASYTVKDLGASLSVDYTFSDEKPTETASPALGTKSLDNKSREHLVRIDLSIPFKEILDDRFRLASSYSHSNRKYLNTQSGQLYSDVAGQKISGTLKTFDVNLEALLWKKFKVKAIIGYEATDSSSATGFLTYKAKKYYGKFSMYY